MAQRRVFVARDAAATLPALSILRRTEEQLTYILRYTPRLRHLCARVHLLPRLDDLPRTLETFSLSRP